MWNLFFFFSLMVQYLIWAFMFFLFMERDCQCFHRHLSIFSMVSTFADGSDTRTLQAPCRHSGGDLALLTDWFLGILLEKNLWCIHLWENELNGNTNRVKFSVYVDHFYLACIFLKVWKFHRSFSLSLIYRY